MSTQARGRADYWKPGDWNALCYQCGRKRKAGDLLRYWQGYWLCPEHWESRQPQDFVRGVPDIQAAPWVQPPGLDGIPQLFVDIGDSEDTYTLTVSTSTVAAVNDTLVIITIMEGVYIGILDLTGLPAGWTVQLNNFGGVGAIIGTATVRAGPPGKPLPEGIVTTIVANAEALRWDGVNTVDLGPVGFFTTQTLYQLAGSPTVAGVFVFEFADTLYVGQSVDNPFATPWEATTDAAIVVGTGWPVGSLIVINNDAKLYGSAGAYGLSRFSDSTLINGTAGGVAIDLSGQTVYLNNTGTIAGGGGGVGGGGAINWVDPVLPIGISTDGDAQLSCGSQAGGAAVIVTEDIAVLSGWITGCTNLGISPLPRGAGLSGTGGDFGEAGTDGLAIGGRLTINSSLARTLGAAAGKAIELSGGTLIILAEGTIIGEVS